MSAMQSVLGPMRLPFLVLGPACVFLGVGASIWLAGSVSVLFVILALIGAVAAHISVNALNEYSDFKSGLDFKTQRTPFSGGSGALPAQPSKARNALLTGSIAAGITALIGIYFLFQRGWGLLPVGVLGLIVILTYTAWLNRIPTICLVAPGLGFGTFMILGTIFVLTGAYSWTAFIASLVPFFLVSNLLLLNQFPDVEADRSIGRRTLPIVSGLKVSAVVYGAFMALTYLAIILGVAMGLAPAWTLLGLATIPLAFLATRAAVLHGGDIPKLIPFMAMNVLTVLLTPVLMGIGFLLG